MKGAVKMEMTLDDIQKKRLKALTATSGNRKGIFKCTLNNCKLSIEELVNIKNLFKSGRSKPEIMKITGHSDYIISGAMGDRYDHLLKRQPKPKSDIT